MIKSFNSSVDCHATMKLQFILLFLVNFKLSSSSVFKGFCPEIYRDHNPLFLVPSSYTIVGKVASGAVLSSVLFGQDTEHCRISFTSEARNVLHRHSNSQVEYLPTTNLNSFLVNDSFHIWNIGEGIVLYHCSEFEKIYYDEVLLVLFPDLRPILPDENKIAFETLKEGVEKTFNQVLLKEVKWDHLLSCEDLRNKKLIVKSLQIVGKESLNDNFNILMVYLVAFCMFIFFLLVFVRWFIHRDHRVSPYPVE